MAYPGSDSNSSRINSQLQSDAGSIWLNSYYQAMSGSSILRDQSTVGIFDKHGSYSQMLGGNYLLNAVADLHLNAGQNFSFSVGNDAQFTFLGQKHEYSKEGGTQLKGGHDPSHYQAAETHQKAIDSVTEARKNAFTGATKDVQCPVCHQQVANDRASAILDKILGGLSNIWPPYIPFSYTTFRKILGGLVVPMISIFTNNTFTKSGTCNHPNCNGSTIKVPDHEPSNKAGLDAIKANQETIQTAEQSLGGQSDHHNSGHNVTINAGLANSSQVDPYAENVTSHNFPTRLDCGKGGSLARASDGTPEKSLYFIQPDHSPIGNVHMNATHSIDITSGSNGTKMTSTGPTEIKSGHIDIQAARAGLNLFGAGLTQIKGKQVAIHAKDNTGDGGVHINSDHTFVSGQLSVGGDLAVTGSIMHDGTLYAPNLVTKSMSQQSEPSASIQSVGHDSSWNSPPPYSANQQATHQNIFSEALHAIKAGFDSITGELLTVTGLYNVVKRATNATKLAIPIDNLGIPTGQAFVADIYTQQPLRVMGLALDSLGKPITFVQTFVVPAYIPVHNSPHNHDNISGMHTHQYVGHEGTPCDTTAGFQSQRPNPSAIPTPARGNGTGVSPADSGSLPISLCFGFGGLNNGKAARNAAYGIEGDGDGTNGGNFVEAYPNYNPDGSLNPPPKLSPFRNC
jgi:hypothetical protein